MPEPRYQAAELRQQAGETYSASEEILTAAEAENRGMTDEERANWERAHADGDALIARAEDIERQQHADIRAADPIPASGDVPGIQEPEGETEQRLEQIHERWITHGMLGLTQEERQLFMGLQSHDTDAAINLTPEERAQAVGTGSSGGFNVPEGFGGRIIERQLAFGGMYKTSNVFTTATGNPLPMPTNDDTANEGEIIAENTLNNDQDVAFGQISMGAWKYSSKFIKVSIEYLQDAAVGGPAWLQGVAATRLARVGNRHFTVGTGTGQPEGLFPAAAVGKTAAGASAIVDTELDELKHSVDPSYRDLPGVGWQFNDSTLLALKVLKDGDGRRLWQSGLAGGTPPTIDNDPYTINQNAPDIGTGNKSIVYGYLPAYNIRQVMGAHHAAPRRTLRRVRPSRLPRIHATGRQVARHSRRSGPRAPVEPPRGFAAPRRNVGATHRRRSSAFPTHLEHQDHG